MVFQDSRGRFASEGEFTPMLQEADDGADTIAWITDRPWPTGPVGMVGQSYLGFTQWLAATRHPEGLRAIAPVVNTSDYYQATWRHRGGVFELGTSLFWPLSRVPEELQRQVRQGKARVEQIGEFTQALADLALQFEHLPLVDQPLLRQFAPYYADWLSHPRYDDYWRRIAHKE